MAFDEGLAQIMRDDLQEFDGVEEKRMFGGLCFMLTGHMLCGVHTGGGMYRVGKERHSEALDIDGATPMEFTGRKMGGFVDVDEDLIMDDTRRRKLLDLALTNVESLPPR